MTTIENFSNFNFLQNINKPLFAAIKEAESMSRTNFVDCGHKSRKACELFIDSVLRKKGLDNQITGDLFNKISSLRDEFYLKQIGYLKQDMNLTDHPILPELGKVKFVKNSGESTTCDYYDYLRRFGNACSHSEQKSYDPKIMFNNVVKCLMGYRLLFSKYYSKQIHDPIGTFEADLMPIDNFYINKASVPADQNRSKCNKEFFGYSLDSRNNISYYAILRQYDKTDVDNNFMLRNSDVFLEASRETISGIPEGMTSFQTIVGLDNQTSSFYITAHLFRFKPMPLTQELLKGTSIKNRIELCSGIAACFYNLHNAEDPIYHRLLTYDSIVVCNFKGSLIPYIVKFDYGKLTALDQYMTVFQQAKHAEQNLQKEKGLTKYLAPEWSRISSTESVEWDKVDVYSLGVLFSDILIGRFERSLASFEELEEIGLSNDLLDMLDTMTSENISSRGNLEYVKLVLEEELKNWK